MEFNEQKKLMNKIETGMDAWNRLPAVLHIFNAFIFININFTCTDFIYIYKMYRDR